MASFSDLITHTRASTATYVDSSGILQTAASGEPRVGHHIYDGTQWVNEGILHESEARTNVLLDSGDPTTANWTIQTTTPTQNATDLFGNANSAWTLEDDNASGFESNQQAITVPDDTNTHTAQFFIGKDNDETRFLELQFRLLGGTISSLHLVQINTSTGAKATRINTASDASFVEDWGNFWRVVISNTNNGTGNTNLRIQLYPAITTTLGTTEASATGSIVYAGGQIELNTSTPSSYIPTADSQVTRAADSMTIPAAKLPYSSTAMSWASDMRITYADTGSATEATLFDWSADASNGIKLTLDTSSTKTGTLTLTATKAGTSVSVDAPAKLTPGINKPFKVAWRVTTSEINIALNGTSATAVSNTAGIPDVSTADGTFGGMVVTALDRGWTDDITDAGIEEATS